MSIKGAGGGVPTPLPPALRCPDVQAPFPLVVLALPEEHTRGPSWRGGSKGTRRCVLGHHPRWPVAAAGFIWRRTGGLGGCRQ